MISYLQYIGTWILRCMLNVLNVFPIKNNRVVFYSFNGKQYSCNPRRISELLESRNPGKYEIIWAFKDVEMHRDELPKYVKGVTYRSPKYYFFAKTARVVVFNVQGIGELSRRSGQTFIQTWHASNGYKRAGQYSGIKQKMYLLQHRDYSYVLSGAKSMSERRVRGSMQFKGPILPGTPRMDAMINRNLVGVREKVYAWLKIDPDCKLLLYAPTWRKNRNATEYGFDYELVKARMEERFGGRWVIAVRLHPNVYRDVNVELENVRDATAYPDMEELTYVADALVSEYSSCIWDYSFTYRPCFLLCTDLKDYDGTRNFDLPIESWGFPVCISSAQLGDAILSYDEQAHRRAMEKHHEDMGSLEDGHATERVCALIEGIMDRRKEQK